jgi:hypothetical protein
MRRFNVLEAAVEFADNPAPYWTPSPDPADNVRVRRGQRLDYFDGEL